MNRRESIKRRGYGAIIAAAVWLAAAAWPTPATAQINRSSSMVNAPPGPGGGPGTVGPARPQRVRKPGDGPLDGLQTDDIDFKALLFEMAEFCGLNLILEGDAAARGAKFGIFIDGRVPRDETCATFRTLMELSEQSFYAVRGYLKLTARSGVARKPLQVVETEEILRVPVDPKVDMALMIVRPDKMPAFSGHFWSLVRNFVSPQGRAILLPESSGLVGLVDDFATVRRILQIVKALDDAVTDTRLYFLPVKHMLATELAKQVTDLFPKPAQEGEATVTSSAGAAGAAQRLAVEAAVGDDRSRKVALVCNEATLRAVTALRDALDQDLVERGRTNILFLQHQKAEELAQTLTGVQQGGQQGAPGGGGAPAGAAPQAGGGQGSARDVAGVTITADQKLNAVVLTGPPAGLREVERLAKALDRPRRQVFLEVHVVEVANTNNRQTGIGLFYARNADGTLQLVTNQQPGATPLTLTPSALQGLAVGARGEQLQGLGGILPGLRLPSFGVVLRVLEQSSDSNVLSQPFLLALDGEDAQLVVGQNVPFVTGSALDPLNQPILSVNRQDVALTLKMKPTIRQTGAVQIQVELEIQDIIALSDTLGPTTAKRAIKATVVTADGETAVLGGLTKRLGAYDRSGPPGLVDVPVIDRIAGVTRDRIESNTLLVFIRPFVVNSQEDFQKLYAEKMKEQEEFQRMRGSDEWPGPPDRRAPEKMVGLVEAIRQTVARPAPSSEAPPPALPPLPAPR